MKRVLLVYAHPSPHKSRYNRSLVTAATQKPFVEVRDLYELYPSLLINEDTEQEFLRAADVLVFQFPIYWFSAPAILKEWQDSVLQNGFAYGEGGTALEGKKFAVAVSTGGSDGAYSQGASHGDDVQAYLKPFEMTARYCGMQIEPAFVTHNARALDYETVKARSKDYCGFLSSLVGEECSDA